MSLAKDECGKRYGRLRVVRRSVRRPGVYWLCECDCGKEHEALGTNLRGGRTRSCGCSRRVGEIVRVRVEPLDCENCERGGECQGRMRAGLPPPCEKENE